LQRALKSVLNQTIQDFEIFVLDDCSDIELKPTIDQFNDTRITYLKLDKKGNANVCRNVGIKKSKGKYIAMLDSDDEWLPDHLAKKIKFIEENNADGVFGSYYINDGEGKQEGLSRPFYKDETMADYILSDGRAATPTQFYKAECAKFVLWDESLLRHQDFDFSVRFAEKFRFVPSPDLTCIVHWTKGEKRTESIESQLQFFYKHEQKIKPGLYNKYFSNLYFQIHERADIRNQLKVRVKKQSSKYIQHCSLVDYLSIEAINKGKIERLFLRFKYSFRVLFS
jgi:glycosyltransferase involved in cell wall biosynthesis